MTAKSTAIKGRGGKFGGRAVKAVDLTSGGLRRVRATGTERRRKARDRGAEVSRGHSRRSDPPKARTVEVASRSGDLARAMRQKIQLELTFGSGGDG